MLKVDFFLRQATSSSHDIYGPLQEHFMPSGPDFLFGKWKVKIKIVKSQLQ
jgi:hypothetical protein